MIDNNAGEKLIFMTSHFYQETLPISMVAHVVATFDAEPEVAEVPRTPPPTPAEPIETPAAEPVVEEAAPIPTSMVAHVVEATPVVEAPAVEAPAAEEPVVEEVAPIPTSMVAHVVEATPIVEAPAPEAPATEAPVVDVPVVEAPAVEVSAVEAPAAVEETPIPTSMVAHVVATAHAEAPVETPVEAPAEVAPIPTSMVAHVVEAAVVEAPKEETAAPAPIEVESWKKDAFEALNKNVSVHNVVAVPAPAAVVAAPAVVAPAPVVEKKSYKIVMIRHGESDWNNENRFCGWFDAGLSAKGMSLFYILICSLKKCFPSY